MTLVVLPNTSVTGANLWSQVEDNDKAIRDVVNGDIDASNLADDAVTTPKIDDAAVTTSKLAGDAVDGTKLADDAVDTEHIADDAVEAAQIADGAVGTAQLADGAVTGAKIPDASLSPAKLGLTVVSDTTNGSGSYTGIAGDTIPSFSVSLVAGTWLITAQLNFDVNNGTQCEAALFNNNTWGYIGQEALFEGEGRSSYSIPVSLTTIATLTDPSTPVGVFYGSGAGGSVDISIASNTCEIRAVRLG